MKKTMTREDERCEREVELLEALASGSSTKLSGVALHVESCEDCRDLLALAGAIISDRDLLRAEAVIPPSGMLWWRIQRRERDDALAAGRRVMTAIQGFTLAAGSVIVFGLAGAMAGGMGKAESTLRRFGGKVGEIISDAAVLPEISPAFALPVIAIAVAWIALAPVAAWVVLRKE